MNLLSQLYTKLPINFSTVTGLRYPELPRLRGKNPLLGRIPDLLKENGILDNLKAAGELAKNHHSGMSYYWLGHQPILLITKPDDIYDLLINNDKNICRGRSFTMFRKFMGSNITVDEKEKWKEKQQVYSDWVAKTSILKQHEPKMIEVVNKYIQYLKDHQHEEINLKNIFNSYALEILLNTVLLPKGYHPDCIEGILNYHQYVTKEIFEYGNIIKWLLPYFIRRLIYKESAQKSSDVCRHMREQLDNIFLRPNEQILKTTDNFIHSIYNLTPHKENDTLISDPNVFGDTSMMLLAGQDTNLATFQFAVKLLSANPEVEMTLRQEIKEKLGGQEFTFENVNRVEYLDMVIKETLRRFPPVTFLPRDVSSSFKLGPVNLKKGDIVIFSPFITHNWDFVWENPEAFIPERFRSHQKIASHSYFPFGVGSHMCIGQRFALQEIKLLLAAIYLNFSITIENNDFNISLEQGALKSKVTPIARFNSLKD